MGPIFSISSLPISQKILNLSSEPRVTLEKSAFEKILAQKEAIAHSEISVELKAAETAMEGAKQAYISMEKVRTRIEASYNDLLALLSVEE